jgi:hypothetical protein
MHSVAVERTYEVSCREYGSTSVPSSAWTTKGTAAGVVLSRISNPQQMTNSGTSCTESQEQFAPDRALMPLMGRRVRRPDVPMSDRVTSKLRARVTVGGHRASRATGLSTVDSVSMNLSLNCCPRQARRTH